MDLYFFKNWNWLNRHVDTTPCFMADIVLFISNNKKVVQENFIFPVLTKQEMNIQDSWHFYCQYASITSQLCFSIECLLYPELLRVQCVPLKKKKKKGDSLNRITQLEIFTTGGSGERRNYDQLGKKLHAGRGADKDAAIRTTRCQDVVAWQR